ncbi:Protein of uncharacterised function (DUF2834) [Mycobacteroides abscessus subsp. abscessus]|uniref:Protein of uncharacterized function (DUF2834) n=1 Tax=Mycobacteroides abscessus TaxID=36809 RepID=A0AB33T653_9MYCO|nr:DUF2834 domain-containing protein [Mycobacteroides abscessus]AWG50370.1 DUF2834 domain-containing protein [Mycobacteroides abscessus]EIC62444.1 hypothetical protein S7W_23761 [Mycobacteroides abscessus M94]MBE5494466.1 hypothetical protein [Mycobacteroides abscessus]MBN7551249.1 DUF2834 domain-containing protein [Mycobacteroides abscessus subsp. abscessus]MDM2170934.1 DUF2834 domain-containing protein [Mycobacteroides abscessus]
MRFAYRRICVERNLQKKGKLLSNNGSEKLLEMAKRTGLTLLAIAGFFAQNAIALPYVRKHGPVAAVRAFFFFGDIRNTPQGKFAVLDLYLLGLAFALWSLRESVRMQILHWWIVTMVLTVSVGVGTAAPFFYLVRDRTLEKSASRVDLTGK